MCDVLVGSIYSYDDISKDQRDTCGVFAAGSIRL